MNRTAPGQSFESVESLGVINVAKWQGQPPPPREWIVDGLIPRRNVTLLSGDGGLGKSLLAQMLLTACAGGKPWLNFSTTPCNVLGIFCEDEPDELQRRQADILAHYGLDMADLAEQDRLGLSSRVGEDNIIARYEKWTNEQNVTPLYEQIRKSALDRGAQLVVLDTLTDLYGGDEISRPQARQFVNLLRRLSVEIDGAVLLTSHVSNEGLKTGSGLSGSTAWRNTVRSHLYLTRPKQSDTEPDTDDNLRLLKAMKSNYSRRNGDIRLCWQQGAFVSTDGTTIDRIAMNAKADRVVIEAMTRLTEMGVRVSHQPGTTYAPAIIGRHNLSEGLSKTLIESAMHRAMKAGKLRSEETGPPSKRRSCLVLTGA